MSCNRLKTCRTCNTPKRASMFYKHPTYADGRMSDCKQCKKAYQRDMHALKRDAYRARRAAYAKRPDQVQRRRAYAKSARGRAVHREANKIYRGWKRVTEAACA